MISGEYYIIKFYSHHKHKYYYLCFINKYYDYHILSEDI